MSSLNNPYIFVPFATWAIAQVAKFLLAAIRHHNRYDWRYLYASGGMPSAHSAVVSALAVTALVRNGFRSPIFGFSIVFAAIVMYDSFGVRRAAGEQAAAINAILDTLKRDKVGLAQGRLREILGHKPLEVTVGALTGIFLGLILNINALSTQVDWLTAFPTKPQADAYMVFGAILIIGTVIAAWWLRRRHRGSKIVRSFCKQLRLMGLVIGGLALILGFAGSQQALYLGWRLWFGLNMLVLGVWAITLTSLYWNRLPQQLRAEREQARIDGWLPKGKRKRRKR
ncbi:MAG TPA: divergent PAP2 family protein [Candidatus Saccharimonadales bacterium]|nr:divergent PAP2 family protein [Candidatus Saccharimonadales bacterium]